MKRDFLLIVGATMVVFLASCTQSGTTASNTTPAANEVAAKAEPVVVEPPKPTVRPVTLPMGTSVRVRTMSTVTTKDATNGQAVRATLEAPLVVNGTTLAPKGADATMVVAGSDDGGRVKGRATIGLRLVAVQMNGEMRDVVSSTFWAEAPGTKKKDAAKVGILTGVGAAIGAIADGGRGAAIGAASGAGAGTAVVLSTHGDPAVIPVESVIQFSLQQPVTVNVKS